MGAPPAKATVVNVSAMRLVAAAEPEPFRREVGTKVGGVAGRIAALELVSLFLFLLGLLGLLRVLFDVSMFG